MKNRHLFPLLDVILLIPLFFLTILLRLPVYTPFTWKSDELNYLSAVQDLSHGGILYISYGDLKPPLLFWIYQLACELGGEIDIIYIKHLGLLFSIITVAGIFFLGKYLAGRRLAFMAALLYALYSICARGEEMLATNSELLMNAFILPAYWLFFKYLSEGRDIRLLLGATLLISAGFFINQKAGINLLVLMSSLGWIAFSQKNLQTLSKEYFTILRTFMIPVVLFVGYYAVIGGLGELQYWLLDMPRAYIGSYDITERLTRMVHRFGVFFIGYWVLSIPFLVGIWAICTSRKEPQILWLSIVLYLLFSTIAVITGGKMMERYFIQLLPAFILISAFGLLSLYEIIESFPSRLSMPFRLSFQIIVIAVLCLSPWQYLQQHYQTEKVKLMTIQTQPELKMLHELVEKNSTATDSIFVFPKGSYYYYFLQRRPASRYLEIETHLSKLAMYPQETAFFHLGWRKLFTDLEKNSPKFIIDISAQFGFKLNDPVHIRQKKKKLKDFIQRGYKKIGTFSGDVVYQRY